MPSHTSRFLGSLRAAPAPFAGLLRCRVFCCAALLLPAALALSPALGESEPAGQQTAPASQLSPAPPSTAAAPQPAAATASKKQSAPTPAAHVSAITEDQLRSFLVGKDLFLRGGYLDNTLEFNEHGALIGHSPEGSYTLCAIRITKVHLLKHKVELEGERYGLHFLSALPGEDLTAAVDRVNITPKKKTVRINIDRELVVKEKPQKKPKPQKQKKKKAAPSAAKAVPAVTQNTGSMANAAPASEPSTNPSSAADSSVPAQASANSGPTSGSPHPEPAAEQGASATNSPAGSTSATATSEAATNAQPGVNSPTATSAPAGSTAENPAEDAGDAVQVQSEVAQAPAAERPADLKSVTATHSQAHANRMLESALDNVFAQGLDPRMMAAMPDYWKAYYQPAGDRSASWPQNSAVLRQSAVDKKARLLSALDPASNQFAQDHGVAGISEYRVVVGTDGKPEEIAVARPIGFGLDENAVQALRKATFEPAVKDGHPVSIVLDMVVEFRIYSKRTAEEPQSKPQAAQTPDQPSLPGPYSVQH